MWPERAPDRKKVDLALGPHPAIPVMDPGESFLMASVYDLLIDSVLTNHRKTGKTFPPTGEPRFGLQPTPTLALPPALSLSPLLVPLLAAHHPRAQGSTLRLCSTLSTLIQSLTSVPLMT